jgi:hypothetical protein
MYESGTFIHIECESCIFWIARFVFFKIIKLSIVGLEINSSFLFRFVVETYFFYSHLFRAFWIYFQFTRIIIIMFEFIEIISILFESFNPDGNIISELGIPASS